MNIKKKKIVKITLIIFLIVLIFLMFWVFYGVKNFAKYIENINSVSAAEIAKPIFVVEGEKDIQISGIQDTIYNFSIKNYNETGTSEVDMNYFIQIENNSDANLDFVLKKDGQQISLNNNKTDVNYLTGLINKEDKYELAIQYHENPAIAQDINGNVQVKVEAVQVEK